MTKPSFKINLVLAIVGVLTVSAGRAMCAATTENLVRVEVYACQQIKIGASSSRPPAHAIHKRGSSITGILITGRVIESEIVWDADSNDAAYLVEAGVRAGDSSCLGFSAGEQPLASNSIAQTANTIFIIAHTANCLHMLTQGMTEGKRQWSSPGHRQAPPYLCLPTASDK